MQRLDILTIVGLVAGVGIIATALFLGGSIGYFWSLNAVLITVGGSLAAALISHNYSDLKSFLPTLKQAFVNDLIEPEELIDVFSELARKARREGLLALEDDAERFNDPFFVKGIQMMVDAMEPETIREILQTDMEYMARRHEAGRGFFQTWGNLAPSFGLMGTLIGLIQMLAQLDNPETLGPSMALALVTTFYGALLGYLVLMPLAGKLKLRSDQELALHQMMLEGIISIQSGVNPRILEERLRSFVAPKLRQQQVEAEEGSITGSEILRERV
ncbi:MAG: motility protein A [Clostridia bacterium]|nr:motility protein A [Clostridia bacterium]